MASIWAPVIQDSSHVGNAGVGVISKKGAPLALPTFVTAAVGRLGVCYLLVLFGSCTWLSCKVIRELFLMLSSLL